MTTNPSPSTESMPSLRIDPTRASTLISNLSSIRTRISSASRSSSPARLVAVSKLKPATDILALHHSPSDSSLPSPFEPQTHFGENYVQELLEKAKLLPRTIRWHFIGGLQSNKCAALARDVPNLWAVESVDSVKKAGLLDKGRGEARRRLREEHGEGEEGEQLRIFVQVNTSGEESKSGVAPESEELLDLCRFVRDKCENLKLQGLMTIGAIARSKATTKETENEDFETLRGVREWVVKELGLDGDGGLELSMGMSEDFEAAVRQGSSEVRVGSTIFGERPPKNEAKVLEDVEEGKK